MSKIKRSISIFIISMLLVSNALPLIKTYVYAESDEKHTISGYVKDEETGKSIKNAEVILNKSTGLGWKTETDSTGYFEYENVVDGTHTLDIEKDGYYAYNKNVRVDGEDVYLNIKLEPDSILPESISIKPSKIIIKVGDTYNLDTSISPSNAEETDLEWDSFSSSVVSVNSSGKITGKKEGTTNVVVETSNGKIGYCKVTVEEEPEYIPRKGDSFFGIDTDPLKDGKKPVNFTFPDNTHSHQYKHDDGEWKSVNTSYYNKPSKSYYYYDGHVTENCIGKGVRPTLNFIV